MIVDGKDLTKKYKGKIKFGQQTIQPRQVNTYTEWLDHNADPTRSWSPETRFFEVQIEMIVSGNTKTEAELRISEAVNDFVTGSVIRLDNVDINIGAEVTDIEKEFIKRWDYKVTVTMQGWEKSTEQITVAVNGTVQIILAEGNLTTPCDIEITPKTNIAQIQLFGAFYDQVSGSDVGITIKNLKQGKKIVISGDDCTVLQEGKNKFSETEFWEFPHLRPGNNTISCTSDQCDIVIKYKPRYM